MGKVKSFFKWLRDESLSTAMHTLTVGILPIVYSAAVAVAAYIEHFPLATLLLIVAATFGFVSWGAFFFQQMVYQKSTAGKLRYAGINLGCILEGKDQNMRTRYVKVRLNLDSTALFPMEFNVEKMAATVGNRVNASQQMANTLISIPAMGTAWYATAPIDLDGVDRGKVIEGTFEYELKYGRPGRLHNTLTGKHKIAFNFKSPIEIGAFEAIEVR